jgi:hypothetical protein
MTNPPRRSYSIRISDAHIAKVQELKDAGLTLCAIFERTIDRVYAVMPKAGLVEGKALEEEPPAES